MPLFSVLRPSALIVGLLLLTLPATAQPDRTKVPMTISLHAQAGYTSFSMNEATDFFRAVVGAYQEQGINIPVQQTYPGNALLGGGVTLGRGGWSTGLHVHYARSEAAALYGDIGGTLDVTSETSLWTVETSTAYTFRRDRRLQPFLGARAGRAIGRYVVTERVRLAFGGAEDEAWAELEAAGTGFSLTGVGGVRYALGPVFLRTEAGYRYASIGNDEDDLAFDISYAGPVVSLGIEVPVGRIR